MDSKILVSSVVSGSGMCVPDKIVPNSHFETYLETSDEWIRERSGIEQRRWTEQDEGVSSLAEYAARDAIKNAGLNIEDIDGIVFGTITPDHLFPSAACTLQKRLGLKTGFAFDVNAVCTGFIYAITVGDSMIANGLAKNVLIVGGDVLSSITNMGDRGTCVLFGDGAGAVVLSAVDGKPAKGGLAADVQTTRGIYASEIKADGSLGDILTVPAGSARRSNPDRWAEGESTIHMDGREVFKFAVRALGEVSKEVCAKAGVSISDVDHFVSHQANKRILLGMAKQLGVGEDKIPMNIEKYGNTSAGTIPILLAECAASGRIKKGDLVLLSAVGGGITWGAVLLRW